MRGWRTGIWAAMFAAAVFMPTTASADIILNPGNADCTAEGPPAGPSKDLDFLEDECNVDTSTFDLLYKSNVGGGEEGDFDDAYTPDLDGNGGTIEWDGGASIDCGTCWLVAKDGGHDPGWYGWNISFWDGQETISLEDLFLGGGSLSHVSIWGVDGGGGDGPGEGPGDGNVPEPASLALLGIAFTGIGLRMRRRRA